MEQEKEEKLREIKTELETHLKRRWPELANLANPEVIRLLASESDEFLREAKQHARYGEFTTLLEEKKRIRSERLDLERRWAKCERFTRLLEEVALAANLPRVAGPDMERRYQQLRILEASRLTAQESANGEQ